jgi:hypothetical protein
MCSALAMAAAQNDLPTDFFALRCGPWRWRALRIGPDPTVIGRHIYYGREAVHRWLRGREIPMVRERRSARGRS